LEQFLRKVFSHLSISNGNLNMKLSIGYGKPGPPTG
jgi:hypothetical protein